MKVIKRLLIILLAVMVVFIVFLAGSIVVDGVMGKSRLNSVTNTVIPGVNGGPDVRAYVAAPQGEGPFPVVIMIHEFFGLNESIIGKAQGLAAAGYLVVAPDTFRGSTTSWIPRAIYQVITSKPERVNQDLDSVYAWLQSQPNAQYDRVGVMGFCYGGRGALNYSLHNDRLAATVIFYGSPVADPAVLQALPAPVLGIFGGSDVSIPVESVRQFEAALDQAGIPNEITIYANQPHAFVTDIESIRQGGVQGEAWAQMLAFLDQHLKQGGASQDTSQSLTYTAPFEWRYYVMLAYEHAFGTASHDH
jgi:carboxymethylenebutenolidase